MEPFSFCARAILAAASLSSLFAADVIESRHAAHDFALTADPNSAEWKNIKGVVATKDYLGQPVHGVATEIRSRWTSGNLYLLYLCPYDELNLKPNPSTTHETSRLYEWDVVEAFLGSEFDHIGHYAEFEMSPQSEWVDYDIDRDHKDKGLGEAWNSGFKVLARVDAARKMWYGEMEIPFASIDKRKPAPGLELRAGLYRCAGVNPSRVYVAWQPTGAKSFHVPSAFGILRLVK